MFLLILNRIPLMHKEEVPYRSIAGIRYIRPLFSPGMKYCGHPVRFVVKEPLLERLSYIVEEELVRESLDNIDPERFERDEEVDSKLIMLCADPSPSED